MTCPNDAIRLIVSYLRPSSDLRARINAAIPAQRYWQAYDPTSEVEITFLLRAVNSLARLNRRFRPLMRDDLQIRNHRADVHNLYTQITARNRNYLALRRFEAANDRDERGYDED